MIITSAGMQYKEELSQKVLDELIKAVDKISLCNILVFLGHPSDLIKMNMSELPSDCYFISDCNVTQGELLMIKDEAIKEILYRFAKKYPDKVFRGVKE